MKTTAARSELRSCYEMPRKSARKEFFPSIAQYRTMLRGRNNEMKIGFGRLGALEGLGREKKDWKREREVIYSVLTLTART